MKDLRNALVKYAYRHRQAVVIFCHVVLFGTTYALAYALRFDLAPPPAHADLLGRTLPIFVVIKVVLFSYFDLYQGLWRYVSVDDLERIIKASVLATVTMLATAYLWPAARSIPRSVLFIDFVLMVTAVGGARFVVRRFREAHRPMVVNRQGRHVLIVGAGSAGEQTLREILFNPELDMRPLGFVDDDPRKRGGSIHGVRILGTSEELGALVEELDVDEILVAIPSATGEELRQIVGQCEELDVRFKVLPAVGDLIAGRVTVRQFREVQIEDLLGRDHVDLDIAGIGHEIEGQTVLITGAGGSIGAELSRQVQMFRPSRLILLDRGENALFFIDRELRENGFDEIELVPIVGDVQDRALLDETFTLWKPSLVYHAAAYKHVPLMEASVIEAVRNNVFGSRALMEVARAHGAERFVMISTDKAVRPGNVMGASKRLAEMIMLDKVTEGGPKFVAVRFGNVLGSRGSVIPIFRKQLQAGGPLTVTHPDVSRYFMTIPEAVQLVMQAGSMGEGGEIFVLEMGEPIKIVDLARRLITLAGKKPGEDIQIVYSGLRPGEKLHEELQTPDEPVLPTAHEKIRVLSSTSVPSDVLQNALTAMEREVLQRRPDRLRQRLMEIVSSPERIGTPRRAALS